MARNYDDLGRPSGIALDANVAVGYSYDAVGRFSSLSSSVSSAIQYSYAPGSDLVAGWSNSSGFVFARTYEANRDLIAQVENTHNGTLIHRFEYENDPLGRRTLRKDTDLSDVITNLFGYNTGSELIEAAMGTNDYRYQYDAIGNRTVVTNNQGALTYLSNELNQYTNIASSVTNAPSYDADGNMTSHAGWTFAWDAENRLLAASNGTTVVHNAYDYMSRRVVKASGGITNRFLYDGWNMIRSISTAATNHYVWGLDLSGTLQGAGGIGGLLTAVLDGEAYFPAFDANGNITEYTDTNGTIVARYEYDPFGNLSSQSGALADDFVYRFSTKYTDDETGLVYYGFRFYCPELGRWPNRDPVGEAGSKGVYVYFDNSGTSAEYSGGQRLVTSTSWSPVPLADGSVGCERVGFGRCRKTVQGCDVWPEIIRASCVAHERCHISQCDRDPNCDYCKWEWRRCGCKNSFRTLRAVDMEGTFEELECECDVITLRNVLVVALNALISGAITNQERQILCWRIRQVSGRMNTRNCADIPDIPLSVRNYCQIE